jgi:hypothetical protein
LFYYNLIELGANNLLTSKNNNKKEKMVRHCLHFLDEHAISFDS